MRSAISEMKIQVFGCSHHTTPLWVREQLAFGPTEVEVALSKLRCKFPGVEAVLLSTCNRVELYSAARRSGAPTCVQWVDFLAGFHGMDSTRLRANVYVHEDSSALRHLFMVTSSLDSMVVGEPQILAQVKRAYELANQQQAAGPLIHAMFQAALRTARRVAHETALHQHRVSAASVAVADFVPRVFRRIDDKQILVIGAGEMAEETLKYLWQQGATNVTVANRHIERARALAGRWQGQVMPWEKLDEVLAAADLVVSTTGAPKTLVSLPQFLCIERARRGRLLLILDLAVPRDFDPAIGQRPGVHLFSIDDLKAACDENQRARDSEMPAAVQIVEEEAERFLAELRHRAVAPTICRLRQGWQMPKESELERLFCRLPQLGDGARDEIRQAFDRLVGKLLHPPLESLRAESRSGVPVTLLDAVDTLFQLKEEKLADG